MLVYIDGLLEALVNDLERYFSENTGRLIHKWHHFFDIYDRHFSRFRGTDVTVVEVGIYHGGSLQMWKDYFGPRSTIIGIDINEECRQFEEEQITVYIGNQEDRDFLRMVAKYAPRIDIFIDDGGHTMKQQITTFEEMYPVVSYGGVYLCEDLHTSYWSSYGGGLGRDGTFVEYSKKFIDSLHAWHSEDKELFDVTELTRSAHSLHFYDSVLVIEKRKIERPVTVCSGVPSDITGEVHTSQKLKILSEKKLGKFYGITAVCNCTQDVELFRSKVNVW